MPTAPATLTIATAIKTQVTTAQSGWSLPFKSIQVGEYRDLLDQVPALEIITDSDETTRITMNAIGAGLTVADIQAFPLTSIVDFTDTVAAWQNIWSLRDSLTDLFHASAQLNTVGVVASRLEGGGKYGKFMQNGRYFLFHKISLHVRFDYTVTMIA